MKKTLTLVLALIMVLVLAAPAMAVTTDAEVRHTPFSTTKISSISDLEKRADMGIDDLNARAGFTFDHNVITSNEVDYETKYTTQLVSISELDGKQYENYIISTIVNFNPISSKKVEPRYSGVGSQGERYNYRIVNQIYYTRDSDGIYAYYSHSSTVYSVIGPVSATPKTLFVSNWVYLDPFYDPEQIGGREVSTYFSPLKADNPYILNSPYPGGILGFNSGMYTSATLTLSDGTSVQSLCYFQNP